MKTLAKIVSAIVACLFLTLAVVRATGFQPIGSVPGPGNYPGLWLSGEVVTTPVTDWSFASQYKTDLVETRTWYRIPHSVTTGHIVYNGHLYLTSRFAKGVPFPQGKAWVRNVMRDPHVRIKFGDKLYEVMLSYVSDPDEKAAVFGERAKPNPEYMATNNTNGAMMQLFRVMPQ